MFSQKVLSSTAVWASMTIGGISLELDDLAAGLADPGQLDLAGAVVDDRFLLDRQLVERRRVVEASSV